MTEVPLTRRQGSKGVKLMENSQGERLVVMMMDFGMRLWFRSQKKKLGLGGPESTEGR